VKKIVVVGSSNTDMVVKTARFPSPGETIIGGDFFMFPGGKGANQAVAAARLGGNVKFICSVGDDLFGTNALEGYQKDGIDVSYSKKCKEAPTGVALITVNAQGENEIVVASGANALLRPSNLEGVDFENSIVLTQLETPIETVLYLAQNTNSNLILNPAPAQSLPGEVLNWLFLITPNETEAELLTGIVVNDEESARKASQVFLDKGVQNVIITLGSKGAFFMNAEESFLTPAQKAKAVDTTAAGDVFNGAVAVGIAQGRSWKESILFANKAAGIAVTKMGAQASAPYLSEIDF
jgi:ribokinase